MHKGFCTNLVACPRRISYRKGHYIQNRIRVMIFSYNAIPISYMLNYCLEMMVRKLQLLIRRKGRMGEEDQD